MALQIGTTAPDFEAQTTEGKIKFHDWIGNDWALLFSHPKDFTPVCTTELGALAKLKPEFDKRGVKLMGLSVDPVDKHSKWSEDIKETQGAAPNYPMIGDTDFNVSKLYDMLPASTSGDVATRTAADNMTVRNVAFEFGSPPPSRAATSSWRAILAKSLPRLASAAPFLCLMVAHFEWPDIVQTSWRTSRNWEWSRPSPVSSGWNEATITAP